MTPKRLNECLRLLGWTERGLARALGIHSKTPNRWKNELQAIPPDIAAWLEARAQHAEQTPPPRRK